MAEQLFFQTDLSAGVRATSQAAAAPRGQPGISVQHRPVGATPLKVVGYNLIAWNLCPEVLKLPLIIASRCSLGIGHSMVGTGSIVRGLGLLGPPHAAAVVAWNASIPNGEELKINTASTCQGVLLYRKTMIPIASFSDLSMAYIARSKLESAGIPCVLENEYLVGIHWFYSNAVGGVTLKVPEDAAAEAAMLLGEDNGGITEQEPDDSETSTCP
jgi:hypothetical protein